MSCKLFVAILCCSLAATTHAQGPSLEHAAAQLQAATVTLRVTPPKAEEGDTPQVSVFSAVSLGKGLMITPLFENENVRVRVTLPNGGQAEALPLVLDEHAGIALLTMNDKTLPAISLAEAAPKAGAWAISAAAWGGEEPVVSVGVVSGAERTLAGTSYPALLQLDLRTAATSSGAGVVNSQGELLGLIVAASAPANQRGWTYAIPISQIRRVLRAAQDRPAGAEGVMVIQRRKPFVGMVMTGSDKGVHIDRIHPGGPAERAGLEVGDEILAVDNLQIRSVYQAVRPILFKQPGDQIDLLVQQRTGQKTVKVTLGGGVVVAGAPKIKLSGLHQPKIQVAGPPTRPGHLAEVGADEQPEEPESSEVTEAAKIALLEKALDRYRSAIVIMQAQVNRQQQERANAKVLVEKLEAEISTLRNQINALKADKR